MAIIRLYNGKITIPGGVYEVSIYPGHGGGIDAELKLIKPSRSVGDISCPYKDYPENAMRQCLADPLLMEGNSELVFCATKERLEEEG